MQNYKVTKTSILRGDFNLEEENVFERWVDAVMYQLENLAVRQDEFEKKVIKKS